MATQDTNRRLTNPILTQDIHALNGLRTIHTYQPVRTEATLDAIQSAYQAMQKLQQAETEQRAHYQAAVNAARLAEWEFHNAILIMKEAVRGQYGLDSNEVQTIGLKKKSARKRPMRRKSESAIAS